MFTRIPGAIRNPTIYPTTGGANMLAKDAEQVLAHLQRAEIELHFASADLGSLGVLPQYPEIEIALLALKAAIGKISDAEEAETPGDAPTTPKAN